MPGDCFGVNLAAFAERIRLDFAWGVAVVRTPKGANEAVRFNTSTLTPES